MATATEQLKEVAVQQYGADESQVESMEARDLSNMLLSKIAEDKYKLSAGDLEGKDTTGMVEMLVKSMVSDLLKVDAEKVTRETSFSDLGADSLDMVELLMTIEDVFEPFGEMKIPEEDANIATVGEAVDRISTYIDDYVGAK